MVARAVVEPRAQMVLRALAVRRALREQVALAVKYLPIQTTDALRVKLALVK